MRSHCTKPQTQAYLNQLSGGNFPHLLRHVWRNRAELLPFSEASCMGHSQRQISGPIRPIISQDIVSPWSDVPCISITISFDQLLSAVTRLGFLPLRALPSVQFLCPKRIFFFK